MNCKRIATLKGNYESSARVYDTNGICPTLTTVKGGNQEVKIIVPEATKKGYTEAVVGDSVDLNYPQSRTRRGRVIKGMSHTLMSQGESNAVVTRSAVRKLTPREYWRLMGFTDEDFDKAQAVNSNTQLYKQAGNSIVVNVLEAILGNLLCE
jgi:DNA (cytosine-5)-methyltransferase 1